jgi:hypothetical protein
MRVRQIGSTVFDNNTNIVVDATALDAVGSGFRVNDLYGPQPFVVEIAFIRSTRQLALRALNTLATELYIRSQRRAGSRLNVAGGVDVIVEDESGNATLHSLLVDASVNLLTVETASNGVIARARVAGTLICPFVGSAVVLGTASSLKAYELRTVALSSTFNFALAAHNVEVFFSNNSGLRNTLFVFETLETATATSRIYRKSPTTVSSNITLESFNAGGTTILDRARFVSGGNGTITYDINTIEVPIDVFNLFFEVYLPSVPSSDVFYTINWGGQPTITGLVDYSKTFIRTGVYVNPNTATTITLQITNAPANTYVSPLVFIPVDGVFVYNATATNVAQFLANTPTRESTFALYAAGNNATPGELRGPAGFIAGRYLVVFAGMMTPTITNLNATVILRSQRIEPASFM